MVKNIVIAAAGMIPVLSCSSTENQREKESPNIILLMVDDLGWRDVGFMGSRDGNTLFITTETSLYSLRVK